jgi:hypothetical protein
MKITPSNELGSHRTGTLTNTTVEEINEILGFKTNVEDDPDKVENSWSFQVKWTTKEAKELNTGNLRSNGAIWDYYGSHKHGQFSTYGDAVVFQKLFGDKYKSDR